MPKNLAVVAAEKIEATAADLFAHHGYNRVSLREITQKAGVNLAAVNYHFGSKESLYLEIFTGRLRAINQTRLQSLGEAERMADGQPVALDLILRLFIEPLFELSQDTTHGGQHFVRIMSRSMVEPLPFLDAVLTQEYHPMIARFAQALRRHVPSLPPDDFLWRISFIVGAIHHTLATLPVMQELTHGICRNNDHQGALRRLVRHSATTLAAPLDSSAA